MEEMKPTKKYGIKACLQPVTWLRYWINKYC